MKVLFLSLLLVGSLSAITKEVIRVFQPVSYHDTDSATEYGVKGELVQAAVVDRAMVLSGAFPEDLVKAVAMPFRFESNNATYDVKEVNLIVLCGLKLEVTREKNSMEVLIDCSEFKIPEELEMTEEQVLTMSIEAMRRTVRVYYQEGDHEAFKYQFRLVGLGEEQKAFKDLDSEFQVGPDLDTSETDEEQ